MDWIAAILELAGAWVVGNKKCLGFLLNILCCLFWVLYVMENKTAYGVLLVTIPALGINARNFLKWRV